MWWWIKESVLLLSEIALIVSGILLLLLGTIKVLGWLGW